MFARCTVFRTVSTTKTPAICFRRFEFSRKHVLLRTARGLTRDGPILLSYSLSYFPLLFTLVFRPKIHQLASGARSFRTREERVRSLSIESTIRNTRDCSTSIVSKIQQRLSSLRAAFPPCSRLKRKRLYYLNEKTPSRALRCLFNEPFTLSGEPCQRFRTN